MKLGAVILAAGYSSRMVDFKPLLEIGGVNALHHCIRLFNGCGVGQVVIVAGHRAEEVRKSLETSETDIVVNPDFADGMYSSICAGVRHLSEVDGFFLLPVDIPLVRPATVHALIEQFEGSLLLYPAFGNRRGHPPLIPARHIPKILSYNGEGGLKQLLNTFSSTNIPVWDRAVLTDMDTKTDFTRLKRYYRSMTTGTREEAIALAEMTLPERGLRHGLAVAEIAETIGNALNGCGYDFAPDILYNGGLLHDIAKGHPNHERAGGELLDKLGLTALSDSVRLHRDATPTRDGTLSEHHLVLLADKLVKGCQPVSLNQRFEFKLEKYQGNTEACRAIRRRQQTALHISRLVEEQCGRTLEAILGRNP